VGQRDLKMRYQQAESLADGAVLTSPSGDARAMAGQALPGLAPAARPETLARRANSGALGRPGIAAAPAAGGAVIYAGKPVMAFDAEGKATVAGAVRQIGSKTFYRRKGVWVDAEVTADEETRARVVAQLTDAYFDLVGKQAAGETAYLCDTEPLVVKLPDGVYRIDPPAQP
jgi:hypothetical protein